MRLEGIQVRVVEAMSDWVRRKGLSATTLFSATVLAMDVVFISQDSAIHHHYIAAAMGEKFAEASDILRAVSFSAELRGKTF